MHQHNGRNPWEDNQWQVTDWLGPSNLCRTPGRRANLVILPNPGKGKVSWNAATVKRPIQGDPRINYTFYRIQQYLSGNTMVMHLDRLEPYLYTTRDKKPWCGAVLHEWWAGEQISIPWPAWASLRRNRIPLYPFFSVLPEPHLLMEVLGHSRNISYIT